MLCTNLHEVHVAVGIHRHANLYFITNGQNIASLQLSPFLSASIRNLNVCLARNAQFPTRLLLNGIEILKELPIDATPRNAFRHLRHTDRA